MQPLIRQEPILIVFVELGRIHCALVNETFGQQKWSPYTKFL